MPALGRRQDTESTSIFIVSSETILSVPEPTGTDLILASNSPTGPTTLILPPPASASHSSPTSQSSDPSTASASAEATGSDPISIPTVVGSCLGALAALILILSLIFIQRRRQRSRKSRRPSGRKGSWDRIHQHEHDRPLSSVADDSFFSLRETKPTPPIPAFKRGKKSEKEVLSEKERDKELKALNTLIAALDSSAEEEKEKRRRLGKEGDDFGPGAFPLPPTEVWKAALSTRRDA